LKMCTLLELAVSVATRLACLENSAIGSDQAEAARLRQWLGKSSAVDLLEDAGFRIEGPGSAEQDELHGHYWWSLFREGWSGIECGAAFESKTQALGDAVQAMFSDEDLDWERVSVRPDVAGHFPRGFAARMAALKRLP
jgi:hypothetical protein